MKWLTVLLFLPLILPAQEKYTISGNIRDKSSGEGLIGANIVILELPRSGATSNAYGFYSISVPEGDYTMVTSFSGYRPDTLKVALHSNITRYISLKTHESELQDVVVTATRKNDNVVRPLMGVQKLSMSEIKN